MRFNTCRPALCMALLILSFQASLAAETPTAAPAPKTSVKLECADAKGATKKECEKVAGKIDAQAANPAAQSTADEAQIGADYVHHSGPAMRTPAEVAQEKAQLKSERKNRDAKPAPK